MKKEPRRSGALALSSLVRVQDVPEQAADASNGTNERCEHGSRRLHVLAASNHRRASLLEVGFIVVLHPRLNARDAVVVSALQLPQLVELLEHNREAMLGELCRRQEVDENFGQRGRPPIVR